MSGAVVPQPPAESGTAADTAAKAERGGRRSLAAALLSGALGAALALVATGRTWAEGNAAVAQGTLPQQAAGDDITGLPGALAVVGLAALVAVFAVRGVGRVLVSGLLALCGAGVVTGSLTGASDTTALEEKAAKATGLTHSAIYDVAHTAWPWVALTGGGLLLFAGLLALAYGRRWPAMSGRYERAAPGRPDAKTRAQNRSQAVDLDRPEELWKALDRGEDPTGAGGRVPT